jgi:FAD/FMN-containing dehydrogenase
MIGESSVTRTLGLLERNVRGGVIVPDSADYDDVRALMLAGRDARPLALVRPVDAEDVASAVTVLAGEGVPFAVRGGGHHPTGAAGGDGVFVIDTRGMKGIDIDAAGRTATAQAGVTAGEYTAASAERGLATGFGDTPTVGIAGLTLGGGLGFLSRAQGLTVDSLLGAEVVTADGRVLWADADSEPDLFWALRGGGPGFGVVTRLRYALRELAGGYGGVLIQPASPEVVHGVVQAALEAPDELTVIVQVMVAPPMPFLPAEVHGKPIAIVRGFHLGDEAAGKAAFASLRAAAAPLVDAVRPLRYAEMLEEPPAPPITMRFATGFRDSWDPAAAEAVMALATEPAMGMRGVQLRPMGGAIARVEDGATAFAHRRRRLALWLMSGYMRPDGGPAALDWLQRAHQALAEGPAQFVSFADDGFRVEDAYPGGTWERLRAVKRAYDPGDLFRSVLSVTPA